MLTREQILSKTQLRIQKVHIDEWEGDVYVRCLTGAERDQFEEAQLIRQKDKKRGTTSFDLELTNVRARLVVLGVCDENGLRTFRDEDVDAISKLSSGALSYLYNVIASLSGITDEDVEDLIKN